MMEGRCQSSSANVLIYYFCVYFEKKPKKLVKYLFWPGHGENWSSAFIWVSKRFSYVPILTSFWDTVVSKMVKMFVLSETANVIYRNASAKYYTSTGKDYDLQKRFFFSFKGLLQCPPNVILNCENPAQLSLLHLLYILLPYHCRQQWAQ